MVPIHRFVEHTSEVELKLEAGTLNDLLRQAARALGELMEKQGLARGDESERTIELESIDAAALLVDWLNELIYLAETDKLIPIDSVVAIAECDTVPAYKLAANLRYASVDEAPSQVKAATRHGLFVKETNSGLSANVILDV